MQGRWADLACTSEVGLPELCMQHANDKHGSLAVQTVLQLYSAKECGLKVRAGRRCE